jgi:protein tyrosine/serine phosphatase
MSFQYRVLLALFLIIPTIAQDDKRSIGIENFGKVNDNYYRGAQPKAEHYKRLAGIGIKTVIDLRDDDVASDQSIAQAAGLKFINFPLADKQFPPDDAAGKFLALAKDKGNWPIFVHCAGGRHRTGAMTAVYRMTVDGWNIDQAYAEMKEFSFYTHGGHQVYKDYVYGYYRGLKENK